MMFFSEVIFIIFLILGILLSLHEIYVKGKRFINRNECIHLAHMQPTLPIYNRPVRTRKRQRKPRNILRSPASFEGVSIN